MDEGPSGGTAATGVGPDADAEAVMARFSLDVSAGCGERHSTLLDEYERLAFEVQLNRAIVLRRCYSEPSPFRFAHEQPPADAHPPRPALSGASHQGEERHERAAAGRLFWRLHEVVPRLMQALEPVFRWLRSAWQPWRTAEDAAARRPPPNVPPRVQLLDYLR